MKAAMCVSNDNKNVLAKDTIESIGRNGYNNIFLQWYNKEYKEFDMACEDQVEYSRQLGLNITFVHLGYKDLNNIWLDGEEGERLVRKYINDLEDVSRFGINMVVMHIVNGYDVPKTSDIGLNRFRRIVEAAYRRNIKIAFENTKVKGYQEYLLDNLDYPNIGICFDSGHYHCHFKDDFDFKRFKNKIFCVHIHDNYGIKDDHLIPGDGTLDFERVIKGLKEANYDGDITLEIVYKENYLNESIDEFYKKSYIAAQKLIDIYKEN